MRQLTEPEPGRFVKIATVGDMTAGNVLAARLRSEGIEVRVHSQALGPYPLTVGDMAETELWVMSDRIDDAKTILLDAEVNDAIGGVDAELDDYGKSRPYDMQIIALVLGAVMAGLFVLTILRVY